MTVVRLVVAAVVFLFLLFLALSNTEPVRLRLLTIAEYESPLAFVVFVAFAAGVAAGLLAGALRAARLRRQLGRLRREVRAAPARPAPHGAAPSDRPPADAL
jgi:uncharacterized integral membrane protein